jgi:sulfate adenylyltransferase subunit 1
MPTSPNDELIQLHLTTDEPLTDAAEARDVSAARAREAHTPGAFTGADTDEVETAPDGAPRHDTLNWDRSIPESSPLYAHTPEFDHSTASDVSDDVAPFDVEQYLAEERAKDLLRFSTAGSVDDGKSTLIGRMLYDTQSVYDDQIKSIEGKGTTAPGTLDLALLTDGLRAEREQGITIDVAYRYFATPRRKFIIADTPGHEQYTRNMATGASTADVAVVLVDARKGVLPQSRRHAYITALLGVGQVIVAVNKMDLVGHDEQTFRAIVDDFTRFFTGIRFGVESDSAAESESPKESDPDLEAGNPAKSGRLKESDSSRESEHPGGRDRASGRPSAVLHFVPVSALAGDNVVHASRNMPWYTGPSLLNLLETVPTAEGLRTAPFRMAVQRVIRPNLDFRGFAGQIASGTVRPGDEIVALPSGRTSKVKSIVTYDGELAEAHAPLSVTLTLEDELDISRGDLLAAPDSAPKTARHFTASLVWMDEQPLELGRRYLLKQTSQTVQAQVTALRSVVDIATLERRSGVDTLAMNGIGTVELETLRPLALDSYAANRHTGSFVLIDAQANATVAAGMVRSIDTADQAVRATTLSIEGPVTAAERTARWGHAGAHLTLTATTEIADAVERVLFGRGAFVFRFPVRVGAAAQLLEAGFTARLVEAGALVLSVDESSGEPRIFVSGSPVALPAEPADAAATALRALEEQGVLHAAHSVPPSSGGSR